MANKQYIGARYVPKFYEGSNGNNWDSGVFYEPLTVVQFLNDSYTSKIPVPNTVGNPANNPKYWAHTGAYNAQIEQYREELENIVNYVNEQAGKSQAYKVEGYKPYAQMCAEYVYDDVTNITAQGFCVAQESALRPLMLFQAFSNSENSEDAGILIYNVLSGHTIKAQHGLSLGHANDVAWNPNTGHWYVACAGGDNGLNKVVELTDNGTVYQTHTFDEYIHPFGICYDETEDVFYINGGDNKVYTFDNTLEEELGVFNINPPAYSSQSIFMMYDRIVLVYFIYIGGSVLNMGLVYNKDGTLFGSFSLPVRAEIEGCFVANDVIYCSMYSEHTGVVALMDIDRGNIIFDSKLSQISVTGIGNTGVYNEYYIDTDTTNVLVDNTSDKPFKKLFNCLRFVNTNISNLTKFHIKGDIDTAVHLYGRGGTIEIEGDNGSIAGIAIDNVDVVSIHDIEINDVAPVGNAYLSIKGVQFALIEDVTFTHAEANDYNDISVTDNSTARINNTICSVGVYADSTSEIVAATGAKLGKVNGSANANIVLGTYVGDNSDLADVNNIDSYAEFVLSNSGQYDIDNISRDGVYRFETGATINHLPNYIKNFIINNNVNGSIRSTLLAALTEEVVYCTEYIVSPFIYNWAVRGVKQFYGNTKRIVYTVLGRLYLSFTNNASVSGTVSAFVENTEIHFDGTITAGADIAADGELGSVSGFSNDSVTRYFLGYTDSGTVTLKMTNGVVSTASPIANGTVIRFNANVPLPTNDYIVNV